MNTDKFRTDDDSAVRGNKERSPNYPVIGLSTAVDYASRIYSKEKRAPVSPQVAAVDMGYTSLNGRTRRLISALKAYGLISEQGGQLKITDEGLKVMAYPEGSPERQAVLRELATKPPIFQTLLTKFGEELPSDANLKAQLITEFGFMDDGAHACIRAFKDTLSFIRSAHISQSASSPAQDPSIFPESTQTHPAASGPQVGPTYQPPLDANWRTVFPVGKNLTVEIAASAPLKARHYDLLIKHINLLKEAAEADEADATNGSEGDTYQH